MEKELEIKVNRAIKLIQSASRIAQEHGQPLEVCYSGGKDSDVILELTKMANVPYRAIYKNTTIDPPGTIKHVKEKGVEIKNPKMSFMDVIKKAGYPTRYRRSCCRYLKEYKILDYSIIGVRREESKKRMELYKEPEQCRVYNKREKTRQYLPILDWDINDIEKFIEERKIKCASLYYDENGIFQVKRRLGCMCCPLKSRRGRIKDFKKYPNMVKFYIRGGVVYLDNHPNTKNHKHFKNVYEWFVMSLFTDSMREFNEKFTRKGMLFDDGIDCKKFLEDYFKIKF